MRILNVFLLCALFLASCSKESDTSIPVSPFVSIINTSPTLGTYLVYVNGAKVITSGLPFGGVIPYRQANTGDATFKFTTESSTESVLTKTFPLAENTAYSLFLIGKDAQMDALLIKDNVGTTSTEKAFIRFINLVPDAPDFDLTLPAGDTLATKRGYKKASEFIPVDPKTYSFSIKDNITGAVKTTLADQVLTVGKYYTVIARGLLNVSSEIQHPLSAQLIVHQ
ncbi:MAG TPA: DUF4397 domain-containing protein [Pedobacter sp.]|nr:DUF4397 domain-containing protein [Pedobacter sp.]